MKTKVPRTESGKGRTLRLQKIDGTGSNPLGDGRVERTETTYSISDSRPAQIAVAEPPFGG